MKAFTLVTVVLSAFLLNGCGEGSIEEQMQQRDIIAIMHGYPDSICQSEELKNGLSSEGFYNIITSVEPEPVHCSDYGRVNDGNYCAEERFSFDYPNACVVAADSPESLRSIKKEQRNTTQTITDVMLEQL